MNHLLVQIRVLVHHDLGVPRGRHEDGVDAAAQRRREDIAYLQADEEREGHDDGRVGPVGVVRRAREDQVQVRQQGAGVGDEGGAHGEHGADQALVDQGVDSAVFDHATPNMSVGWLEVKAGFWGAAYRHVSLAAGMYALP